MTKNLYSVIYKACIYASVIAFFTTFFTTSYTSFGAYLAGYSVLTLGLLIILLVLFSRLFKTYSNESTFQILYLLISTTGPFILMFGVVSFILYLLITYKNNIVDNNTSPGYDSISTFIILVLLSQLYIVITNMDTEKFEQTGKFPKMITSILYLFGTVSAISSIMLYQKLKYFSTDGFIV
jgi:hypothetical protein